MRVGSMRQSIVWSVVGRRATRLRSTRCSPEAGCPPTRGGRGCVVPSRGETISAAASRREWTARSGIAVSLHVMASMVGLESGARASACCALQRSRELTRVRSPEVTPRATGDDRGLSGPAAALRCAPLGRGSEASVLGVSSLVLAGRACRDARARRTARRGRPRGRPQPTSRGALCGAPAPWLLLGGG